MGGFHSNPDINKKFDEVNKGQKVLTEDSIGSIKEHAAQLILMKLLKMRHKINWMHWTN